MAGFQQMLKVPKAVKTTKTRPVHCRRKFARSADWNGRLGLPQSRLSAVLPMRTAHPKLSRINILVGPGYLGAVTTLLSSVSK
jgi:hypothetical protein